MADVSDTELAEAKARWRAERSGRPIPVAVRYDSKSGRIVVDFENGAAFMVPSRALEGLQEATEAELAEVELLGETGLHWETLDVDYTISGLMSRSSAAAASWTPNAAAASPAPPPRQKPAAATAAKAEGRVKSNNDCRIRLA